MYKAYKEQAEFFLVYVREAHPSDGSRPDPDKRFAASQPTDLAGRANLATKCVSEMKLSLPVLIDRMDGAVEKAYGAWPDRICVIDVAGKVMYHSAPGPAGFKVPEANEALRKMLGK